MAFKVSAGHDLARWTWPVALMDESVPFSACDLTKSQQLYKTARVILGMTQYSIIIKIFLYVDVSCLVFAVRFSSSCRMIFFKLSPRTKKNLKVMLKETFQSFY